MLRVAVDREHLAGIGQPDEVARNEPGALMEQLVGGVLAVRARLSPDRTSADDGHTILLIMPLAWGDFGRSGWGRGGCGVQLLVVVVKSKNLGGSGSWSARSVCCWPGVVADR